MGSDARRWWILAAMTGTLSMILLDQTVVSVALPTIQRDLDTTQTELQWVVNAYLLSLAALVAVGGRLADMFNRVGVLIAGIVLFVGSSAACGLAQSETFLIAARVLQGVGAALMIPPTGAIVINTFAPAERGKAMGIYAGISMIFLSLGPLVGGLFTEYVSWRWVFWVNLPVGALTIAMILRTRPEGRVPPGQRLDVPGLLTLVPGLAAIVLPLMQSSTWGWGSAVTILLLAGGVLLVAAFIALETRVPSPLVQLRLFLTRNFPRRHACALLHPVRPDRHHGLRGDLRSGPAGLRPGEGGPGAAPAHDPRADRRAAVGTSLRPYRAARPGHCRHAPGRREPALDRGRAARVQLWLARPGLRRGGHRHRARDEPQQHRRHERRPARPARPGVRGGSRCARWGAPSARPSSGRSSRMSSTTG
jgi:MFS family permease